MSEESLAFLGVVLSLSAVICTALMRDYVIFATGIFTFLSVVVGLAMYLGFSEDEHHPDGG